MSYGKKNRLGAASVVLDISAIYFGFTIALAPLGATAHPNMRNRIYIYSRNLREPDIVVFSNERCSPGNNRADSGKY